MRLSRALRVGRALSLTSRDNVLSCPAPTMSSACTFVRAATAIWIGKIRRVSGGQVSLVVHVMSPSVSAADRNRIAGYSMEVIVEKDGGGRWGAARMGKVVAG